MLAPSGTCAVVGTPTVRLAYSSAKNSRHILETHWLGFSMLMVIFARGHGSGSVDRQVITRMSAPALSLGAHLPLDDIGRLLLRCLCCVAYGAWRLHVLIG